MMMDHGLMLGDRVEVVGEPHAASHSTGTVRQIVGCALGIQFDGTTEIHHWYVASEVAKIGEHGDAGEDDEEMEMRKARLRKITKGGL